MYSSRVCVVSFNFEGGYRAKKPIISLSFSMWHNSNNLLIIGSLRQSITPNINPTRKVSKLYKKFQLFHIIWRWSILIIMWLYFNQLKPHGISFRGNGISATLNGYVGTKFIVHQFIHCGYDHYDNHHPPYHHHHHHSSP